MGELTVCRCGLAMRWAPASDVCKTLAVGGANGKEMFLDAADVR